MFYPQVSQAKKDGYSEYKDNLFKKDKGYLYSFTGLRGDAKRLYKDIKEGKEKRVELVKAKTWDDQRKYVE